MQFDSSLIITFGNVAKAGTNKIKASKNGKDIEFAKRTRISCDKNHITGVTALTKVIMTPHGFIADTPNEINKYKNKHSEDWKKILGSDTFDVIEEEDTSRLDLFDTED